MRTEALTGLCVEATVLRGAAGFLLPFGLENVEPVIGFGLKFELPGTGLSTGLELPIDVVALGLLLDPETAGPPISKTHRFHGSFFGD